MSNSDQTGTGRWCTRLIAAGVLLPLLSGCIARSLRIQEKGLTCAEAHQVAIKAVRRLSYSITSATKPAPGSPGMIVASRPAGDGKQALVVTVFCTNLGAEVEAKTEGGGLTQLGLTDEFRRSFEAATVPAPPRAASATGLDVLVTPTRDGDEASLTAAGVLAVSVRITNRTTRTYGVRAEDVVLQRSGGERVIALSAAELTAKLGDPAAAAAGAKLLADGRVGPDGTVVGLLYFPFQSYAGARVVLTDRENNEPEGFSIEF